jgi:urease accessory protein UreH
VGLKLDQLQKSGFDPGASVFLTIEMSERSSALVDDAFAIGRVTRGEKWEFKELVDQIAVNLTQRPRFLRSLTRLDRSIAKLADACDKLLHLRTCDLRKF